MKQASQVTLTYEEALEAFFHFINTDERMLRRQVVSHANIPKEVVVTIVDREDYTPESDDGSLKNVQTTQPQVCAPDEKAPVEGTMQHIIRTRNIRLPPEIDLADINGLFLVRFSPNADFKPFQCEGFVSAAASGYTASVPSSTVVTQNVFVTPLRDRAIALSFERAAHAAQLVAHYGTPVIEPYGTTQDVQESPTTTEEKPFVVLIAHPGGRFEYLKSFTFEGHAGCIYSRTRQLELAELFTEDKVRAIEEHFKKSKNCSDCLISALPLALVKDLQLQELIEHYHPSVTVALQQVLNHLHKLSIPT